MLNTVVATTHAHSSASTASFNPIEDRLQVLKIKLPAVGVLPYCPKIAQRQAQRAERETGRSTAKGCERESEAVAQKKTPKPLQIADLSDTRALDATECESSGRGTRTPDTRIMIPLL